MTAPPLAKLDALADRHQLSPVSKHAGHDPADPRVAMVEDMAIDWCGRCAEGIMRFRHPESGEFVHPDDLHYECNECEAHSLLRVACEHGVPIYTGAELFPETED